MVRECRPPAREPVRSWLARRSTMATSTPASANSPANISPVGPPPAITTACSVIATLRSASRMSLLPFLKGLAGHRIWPTSATLRHDPGLAASPRVRDILEVARERDTRLFVAAVDGHALCEAAQQ